ncbi:MAG: hypothetical protein JXA33_08630 [Anaerolineae bacterium]|nr:hypothetical protein [Anaerolineae bacterium]
MTGQANFSNEEWVALRAMFCAILLDIAVADHTLDDAETKAWHVEMDALAQSATPLVRSLVTLQDHKYIDETVMNKAARTSIGNLLSEVRMILKRKTTAEEFSDYVRSVRSLAIAVAEGSTGGDKEENRALVHLNDILWQW